MDTITGSNPVSTTKTKLMRKDKLKILGIMLIFISLFIWSFYIHRNEPNWFETKYVKINK